MMFDQEATVEFLTALGDHTRLEIIFLLGSQGRLSVGGIAERFSISRPAISHHLKVLKQARILKAEKVGQEIYYWLDCPAVAVRLHSLGSAIEECTTMPQE